MGDELPANDEPSEESLIKVCRLLNEHGVRYLIVGGFALALHQVRRFTQDVDVLIEPTDDNFRRVIDALGQLADGAAKELSPADFIENKVVKIVDEIEVDVSTLAWVVTYDEAVPNALSVNVEGVVIPYLGLKDLVRSKQTYRDQDRIDVQRLCEYSPEARAVASVSLDRNSGCVGMLWSKRVADQGGTGSK